MRRSRMCLPGAVVGAGRGFLPRAAGAGREGGRTDRRAARSRGRRGASRARGVVKGRVGSAARLGDALPSSRLGRGRAGGRAGRGGRAPGSGGCAGAGVLWAPINGCHSSV